MMFASEYRASALETERTPKGPSMSGSRMASMAAAAWLALASPGSHSGNAIWNVRDTICVRDETL